MGPVDWNLYRRLKAEGRLNILFRLSEPTCVSMLRRNEPPVPDRPNVVRFVSRAEQLAWREQSKRGRWVRLSWPPHEREAILRQDHLFREADERWGQHHGPLPGGARLLLFERDAAKRFYFRKLCAWHSLGAVAGGTAATAHPADRAEPSSPARNAFRHRRRQDLKGPKNSCSATRSAVASLPGR